MGTSVNMARCRDCEAKLGWEKAESFGIVLEWLSKDDAKKEIEKTKCPVCGSDKWYLTDEMGQ
jgi:Zn finger protein HypA/HybF involved in hydrogenase expression